MSAKCVALTVTRWQDVEIAVARFEGEKYWRALMSIGPERLSEYELRFPTEQGARSGAYLGVQMYMNIIRNVLMPPPDSLEWRDEKDREQWTAQFFSKPVWLSPAALKYQAHS